MRFIFLSIAFLTLLNWFNLFGTEIVIKGKAPAYAGQELKFYTYKEWITKSEELLGSALLSDSGKFELHLNIDQTTYIFTYQGIYKAYMYVEPGKNYQIILPPREEKRPEDMLNPYFEYTSLQLGISNSTEDDINLLIRMFDDTYNPYYNKHVSGLMTKQDNFETLDTDLSQMEKIFSSNQNVFFANYRKYRYALLRHLAYQKKSRSVSDEFFKDQPVLYNNPAYMELFNQIYDGYFIFFSRTGSGEKIFTDINELHSLSSVYATLQEDEVLKNDTLRELVVIKNIYDEFYRDKFSRSGLLSILDSVIIGTSINKHKEIATIIKTELTSLAVGYKPPYFELYDADSNLIKLSDFKGKYVYLNFCSCQSYTCLTQFELLSGIYNRHKNHLEIVTISLDPYEDTFKTFMKKHNYNWKFLYYANQPEIIKEYDIRGFPTYFLIAPDGTLINSPAASPEENFEGYLFKAMKARGDL